MSTWHLGQRSRCYVFTYLRTECAKVKTSRFVILLLYFQCVFIYVTMYSWCSSDYGVCGLLARISWQWYTFFFMFMKDFNKVVLLRSKWAFTSFEVSTLTDRSKRSHRSKWDDFIGVVQGRRIKYFTLLLKNAARNYSAVTKWHLPFWLKVWWNENCVNRIFMNDFIWCDIIL